MMAGTDQAPALLPWNNVNRVEIIFDYDVVIQSDDLSIRGYDAGDLAVTDFSYDADGYVATWTIVGNLPADNVLFELSDAVTDRSGRRLDGDRDGTQGGAFARFATAIPGDANRDARTSIRDLIAVRNRLGADVGQPEYSVFHDLDGSGHVDATDMSVVRGTQFIAAPTGLPPTGGSPSPAAAAVSLALLQAGPVGEPVATRLAGTLAMHRPIATGRLAAIDRALDDVVRRRDPLTTDPASAASAASRFSASAAQLASSRSLSSLRSSRAPRPASQPLDPSAHATALLSMLDESGG
jgi:hypothetical protein